MSTTYLRAVPMPIRPARRDAALPVVDVTVVSDERVLLSVPEAAHRLGIGRSFLYELIAAGQIETITIGRLRRISVEAIDDFVARRRAAST